MKPREAAARKGRRQGVATSRRRQTSLGRAGTSQLHQRGETPSRQEGWSGESDKARPDVAGDAAQHSRPNAVQGKVPPNWWPRAGPPGPSCGQGLTSEEPDKVPPDVQERRSYFRPEQAKGTGRQSRSARPGTEDKGAQIGEREGGQPREGPPDSRHRRPDSLRLPASGEGVGFILQRRRECRDAVKWRDADGAGALRRRQPMETLKDRQLAKEQPPGKIGKSCQTWPPPQKTGVEPGHGAARSSRQRRPTHRRRGTGRRARKSPGHR